MKKVFLLLSLMALTFVSCNDDDTQEGLVGPNGFYVGFPSKVQTAIFDSDLTSGDVLVPVSFVSYQNENFPETATDVTWTLVSPEDYLSTVSFESEDAYDDELATYGALGTEYDFASGTSGTVTIAGGTGFVNLPEITAHPNLIDPLSPKKFALRLESASNDVVIAEQYRYIVVTLQTVCVSALEGMYDLSVTRLDNGTVYDLPGEELTKVSPTRYRGTSIGPYNSRGLYGPNAQIPGVGLVFDDVCNSVSLWQDPDWNYSAETGVPDGTAQFLGPYYNAVYQTTAQANNSSVDPLTGIITIEYNVWFAAGTRQYIGIYTPQ